MKTNITKNYSMKTVYVVYAVYRTNDSTLNCDTFKSATIKIEGKLNHLSIKKAIMDKLRYYDQNNFIQVISWQEEDAFTFDEEQEFWKNIETK